MNQPTELTRHSRRAVWVCYAAMMCLSIAVNLPPIYLTTFSDAFGGLSPEEMGRIPAFVFAGLVIGIVVSGPPADRFGGKLFAALGLGLVAAGLGATAASGTYVMLLASAFVMGLGAGVLDMVLSPIVAALEPGRRTAAMNYLHSFYCAGALATTFAGALALRAGVPWRLFAAAGALAPVAVLVRVLRLRVPPLVAEGNAREPAGRLLTSAFFVAALAAMLLTGASEAGMASWLPAFAERVMGYAKSTSAGSLSAFLAAMWLGRIVAATLGHRVSAWAVLGGSAALAAVGYLGGVYLPWRAAALTACVATGLGVGSLWPTTLGLAANRIHHGGATMFGLLAAAGNTGCLVMPWLIGVVAGRSSLPQAMAWAAAAPIAMLAAVFVLGRLHAPREGA